MSDHCRDLIACCWLSARKSYLAVSQAFGLAVLMAKAGLPVPATAPARLPPFSAVLADIGDEQSLFANLSTFSGHLKRIQVPHPSLISVCKAESLMTRQNSRRN